MSARHQLIRWLRPNLTGGLLLLPAAVALGLPRFSATYFPSGETRTHGELGYPTWLSWDTPGTWHLHAAVIPALIALWVVPMGLGAVLERWSPLRLGRGVLALFAAVPAVALAIGVGFSLQYWGYPWSLPELDARVTEVKWRAVGSFTSQENGRGWELQPREDLDHLRVEPASDSECCQDGRILGVLRSQQPLEQFALLTPAELGAIEAELLSQVTLEAGEPGYTWATRLHGVVTLGDQDTVVFASFVGGEVSNDHHAMYEVLLRRPATLLSSRRSYGDVAGIEGMSALVVSVTLFIVLGLFGVPLLVVGGSLARSIFVWARWRFSLKGTRG